MVKTILVLESGEEIVAGLEEENAIQNSLIEESSNDGEDLTIGSVCAKKISIKIITPQNKLVINAGEKIELYQEENGLKIKKGIFNAEKPRKIGANTTNIIAYDNISILDRDVTKWFNNLDNFPYTSYNMAKMVCDYCGVGFANSSIDNGDYLINKQKFESVTGRQIIRWIGEICGCFCIANEDGDIFYKWYEKNNIPIVAIPIENSVTFMQGGLSYEDYEVKKIDTLQIGNITSYPAGIVGNAYYIHSNPFLINDDYEEDKLFDISRKIYEKIKDITYVPCKVTVPASLHFNVGDIIDITDSNGIKIVCYIMKKVRNGQKETISCTGNHKRNGATTLYSTSFNRNYGMFFDIQKDVNKLKDDVSSANKNLNGLAEQLFYAEQKIEEQYGMILELEERISNLETSF